MALIFSSVVMIAVPLGGSKNQGISFFSLTANVISANATDKVPAKDPERYPVCSVHIILRECR
jgi:hypothetical protein